MLPRRGGLGNKVCDISTKAKKEGPNQLKICIQINLCTKVAISEWVTQPGWIGIKIELPGKLTREPTSNEFNSKFGRLISFSN